MHRILSIENFESRTIAQNARVHFGLYVEYGQVLRRMLMLTSELSISDFACICSVEGVIDWKNNPKPHGPLMRFLKLILVRLSALVHDQRLIHLT